MIIYLKSVRLSIIFLLSFALIVMHAAPILAADIAQSPAIPAVIEKTTPSVVAIIGKPSDSDKEWDTNRFDLQHGTGVIVREDGYIITNAHVVKHMGNIVVVTSEGKSYSGKTTHYDEESDLALVKIEAYGLPAASFAAQSDIHVGDTVVAIGTPLSFALRNSVTVGIVSGIERAVNSKYQLIQTDAAINPGNSGGALVNLNGQVIGINTMKFVDFGIDSLGFAIPVDTVQYVLEHFYKYGKVKRPYLGLELEESWEAVVGLPSQDGLHVSYVDPDSPAAKSNIKQGDVLVSIGQDKVTSLVNYNEVMKKYLPNEKIKLTLQTSTGMITEEIILEEDESAGTSWMSQSTNTHIDSDQGKTKIGDSHHGWSMKYPAGLIKGDQSDDGDKVTFDDSKGNFSITVSVDEKQSEDLSIFGLFKKLAIESSGTILEKRYVEQAAHPYVKVAGKSYGSYYQARAYQHKDKIYYITLDVDDEENYKHNKQNSLNDLLDSFSLTFDSNDTALKDISVYQNTNTITNDYGLSLDIPADWGNERKSSRTFLNKDYTQSLSIEVTSAASGDTLQDWAARQEKIFSETYVDTYREIDGKKEMTIGDMPAVANLFSFTMGDKWHSVYTLYFIKDKYKYKLEISYPKDADQDEIKKLVSGVVDSVKIVKDDVDGSLGFIQDDDDLVDMNKTATYTNKKYNYSLQVPEIWSTNNSDASKESSNKFFSFHGGRLGIEVEEQSSFEDVVKKAEQNHKNNAEDHVDYKYHVADETVFDVAGKKIEVTYKTQNLPFTIIHYIFQKQDKVYEVTMIINDAVKTESNWNRLLACFQTMKFLKDE